MPVLVWFLPRTYALAVLVAGVLLAVGVEAARWRLRWARYYFLTRTRHLLRAHERDRVAGATYMALGYLLAFLIFPRPIAVLAMLYSGLGDAAAALVGRRWGRHRMRWGKSWEGAAAGLVVNVVAGVLVPGVTLVAAAIGGAFAAALELLPLPLDDNLRVTLGGGTAVWVLSVLAAGLG